MLQINFSHYAHTHTWCVYRQTHSLSGAVGFGLNSVCTVSQLTQMPEEEKSAGIDENTSSMSMSTSTEALIFFCFIRMSLLSSATFDSFVSIELISEFAVKCMHQLKLDFLGIVELIKRQNQRDSKK